MNEHDPMDCPYCNHPMEWSDGYICGNCDVEWDDEADVTRSYIAIDLAYEQMTGGYD